MNTKIVSFLTALGFIFNAANAENSARIGYASDYFYRGVQKAEESVQGSIYLEQDIAALKASLHACTNQAVEVGNDSYHIGGGLSSSFIDGLFDAYIGINHFEDLPGTSLAEVELGFSFNTLLNPSISFFRDFDESLYTYELGISHDFEIEIFDIGLHASYGNTETSSANDTDYYGAGVSLSRDLSDSASLAGSINYVDADNIDDEFIFGVGLTFNF